MSFDIFVQDFSDDTPDRSREVLAILRPLLDNNRQNLITADGSAAVYGLDDSPLTHLMFNHVEGEDAWQVIYETAFAADWVVMPVGVKTCIVNEAQRSSIPPELAEIGVAFVTSGPELLDVVVAG